MLKKLLSQSDYEGGYNATLTLQPEGSETSYLGPGSRNLLLLANMQRPWRGFSSQGSGSRQLFQIGSTWGGLRDTGFVEGKGSFFSDIGKSLWFIGAGIPVVETTAIGAGIAASTTLKVSIASNGVYDISTTYDAGLPAPSAPDIGIIGTPGVGFVGRISNPVSAKIARLRSTTGARSNASPTSSVVSPVNQTVRVTYPLPADGQDYWLTFFTQQGFGGVGLHYRAPYGDSLDIPESLIGGVHQVETATVVGTITLAGNATVIVTAVGMTGTPRTVTVAVLLGDTASVVAGKMRSALALDVDVSGFFTVTGTGANIALTALTGAANDGTMNIATNNSTCTGLTPEPTSTNTTAGTAPAQVDGIPRSLEFDFVDGDLVPEVAYIDDYPPPAGTNACRIENVMCVLGAYGDATSSVTTSDSGTVGAISNPNFYESYTPRFLVYFPEAVVDVLTRLTDSYAYVAHKNSITALQYVGIRDGPAVAINTITPDIGVPFPSNWCQVQGLLYVYSAKGALWRMLSNGEWDNSFSAPIREFIQDWEPEDTVLGWRPDSMSVVAMNGAESVSWNLQNSRWSPPQYFSDAQVSGTALSATNSQGQLLVTLNNSGTQTVYAWDEGATEMPVTAITNWTQHIMPASVEEILSAFEIDNTSSPLIVSVHRNVTKTFVQDATTTNLSNTITSASASWDQSYRDSMVCVFGEDVGGANIDYLIGTIATVAGNNITIVDVNGAVLNAHATLSSCYMLIANFIFTYDFTRTGAQQTPPLLEPYVTDCMSHCVGLSLLTYASKGRFFVTQSAGTTSNIMASVTV